MLKVTHNISEVLSNSCSMLKQARELKGEEFNNKLFEAVDYLIDNTSCETLKTTLENTKFEYDSKKPTDQNFIPVEKIEIHTVIAAIGVFILGNQKNDPKSINLELLEKIDHEINDFDKALDLITTLKLATSLVFKESQTFVEYSEEICKLPKPYSIKTTALNNLCIAIHLDHDSYDSIADLLVLDTGLDFLNSVINDLSPEEQKIAKLGILSPTIWTTRFLNQSENMACVDHRNQDFVKKTLGAFLCSHFLSKDAQESISGILSSPIYPDSDPLLLGASWGFFSEAYPKLYEFASANDVKISSLFFSNNNNNWEFLEGQVIKDVAQNETCLYQSSLVDIKLNEFAKSVREINRKTTTLDEKAIFINDLYDYNYKKFYHSVIKNQAAQINACRDHLVDFFKEYLGEGSELYDSSVTSLVKYTLGDISAEEMIKELRSTDNSENKDFIELINAIETELSAVEQGLKRDLYISNIDPEKGLAGIKRYIKEEISQTIYSKPDEEKLTAIIEDTLSNRI